MCLLSADGNSSALLLACSLALPLTVKHNVNIDELHEHRNSIVLCQIQQIEQNFCSVCFDIEPGFGQASPILLNRF